MAQCVCLQSSCLFIQGVPTVLYTYSILIKNTIKSTYFPDAKFQFARWNGLDLYKERNWIWPRILFLIIYHQGRGGEGGSPPSEIKNWALPPLENLGGRGVHPPHRKKGAKRVPPLVKSWYLKKNFRALRARKIFLSFLRKTLFENIFWGKFCNFC